jgi:hypothetical protein
MNNADPGKCYARKPDGTVFGPVDREGMIRWARDGRIGPADKISFDSKTWKPAAECPELDMSWQITLGDGSEYGPVNLLALCALLNEKAVNYLDRVRNVRTGMAGTVAEVLLPALLEERRNGGAAARADKGGGKTVSLREYEELRQEKIAAENERNHLLEDMQEIRESLRDSQIEREHIGKEMRKYKKEAASADERIASREAEIEKRRKQYTAERDHWNQHEKELAEKMKQLQQAKWALESKLRRVRNADEELRKQQDNAPSTAAPPAPVGELPAREKWEAPESGSLLMSPPQRGTAWLWWLIVYITMIGGFIAYTLSKNKFNPDARVNMNKTLLITAVAAGICAIWAFTLKRSQK